MLYYHVVQHYHVGVGARPCTFTLKPPITLLMTGRSKFYEQGLTAAVFFSPSDFTELSLDPNTAHRKLKLSDNNKKATYVREDQPYPDHQDRFDRWVQLLCDTGLTGRCYWEVQWSGGSWSLSCSERGFSPCSSSGTVGVFVDCAAGSLSFYTVSSDKLIHLHTFNTTFTQTLIPGFMLWTEDSSVSLSD
uniref:Si:ch211-256e16.11 n=1 Tax=Neogobius melanostomus TaxID=47308 RepID=A0A8C6U673_9GOBI